MILDFHRDGFIKLPRQILDPEDPFRGYSDLEQRLYIFLYLLAEWRPRRRALPSGSRILVPRGNVLVTQEGLAEILGCTRPQIRTALRNLARKDAIATQPVCDETSRFANGMSKVGTLVSLTNYDTEQARDEDDRQDHGQPNRQRPSNASPSANQHEGKESSESRELSEGTARSGARVVKLFSDEQLEPPDPGRYNAARDLVLEGADPKLHYLLDRACYLAHGEDTLYLAVPSDFERTRMLRYLEDQILDAWQASASVFCAGAAPCALDVRVRPLESSQEVAAR